MGDSMVSYLTIVSGRIPLQEHRVNFGTHKIRIRSSWHIQFDISSNTDPPLCVTNAFHR